MMNYDRYIDSYLTLNVSKNAKIWREITLFHLGAKASKHPSATARTQKKNVFIIFFVFFFARP